MTKKEKIQIGFTGVLVLIMMFAGCDLIKKIKKSSKKKPVKEKSSSEITLKPIMQSELSWQKKSEDSGMLVFMENEVKDFKFKRDPFFAQTEPTGPVLQGIVLDQKKPLAIISGEVVSVGQNVFGYAVVEITDNTVTLDNGQKKLELYMEVY